MAFAATEVAERIAAMGAIPLSTMMRNWRALSPWGKTAASVPKPIATPSSTARVKRRRCSSVVARFLSRNSWGQPCRRPSVSM